MTSTPFNTPRRQGEQYAEDFVAPTGPAGRVGGGFDTSGIGQRMLRQEDALASGWRAMASGPDAYNPVLEAFVAERRSDRLAANSFLFSPKDALRTANAPALFELSHASTHFHHNSQHGRPATTNASASVMRTSRNSTANNSNMISQQRRRPHSASAEQQRSRSLYRVIGGAPHSVAAGGIVLGARNSSLVGGADQRPLRTDYQRQQEHDQMLLAGGGGQNGAGYLRSQQPYAALYQPHRAFTPLTSDETTSAAINTSAVSQAPPAAASSTALVPVGSRPPTAGQSVMTQNECAPFGGSHFGGFEAADATATHGDASALLPPTGAGPGDLSRHTTSSYSKLRLHKDIQNAETQAFAERNAPDNYTKYIRQMNEGQVSSVQNTTAMLDALAMGENAPQSGYGPTAEYRATNASLLRVLKNSQHLVDRTMSREGVHLSCCSGSCATGVPMPGAGTKVDGLFVTFCQQDVYSRLDAAARDLEMEKGAHEHDQHLAEGRIAQLLRETMDLKQQLQHLTLSSQATEERLRQELKDAATLKDSYADKLDEVKLELDRLRNREVLIAKLESENEEKAKKITALEVEAHALKTNLAAAERQVADSYKVSRLVHEEKLAAEAKNSQLQRQIDGLHVAVNDREKLLEGSEYRRRFVEEKMANMAFLTSKGQQLVKSTKATK